LNTRKNTAIRLFHLDSDNLSTIRRNWIIFL